MAQESGDRLPDAVLFACNLNRVRSPMAEALLKRAVGDRVFVDSCGLNNSDGGDEVEVDPLAAEVMRELGCELSAHRAKTFEDLEDGSFDLVISLTPEAHNRAIELSRGRASRIEFWPISDPTLGEGSRSARLEVYRHVRDALAERIAERFAR